MFIHMFKGLKGNPASFKNFLSSTPVFSEHGGASVKTEINKKGTELGSSISNFIVDNK